MKKVFAKDFLESNYDLPFGGIDHRILSEDGNGVNHETVFKHGDKFWRFQFLTFLETSNWYDWDEVECTEVKPVQKIVTEYEIV